MPSRIATVRGWPPGGWPLRDVALLAALPLLVAVQAAVAIGEGMARLWGYDFRAYWLAGRRLEDGAALYGAPEFTRGVGDPNAFLYPPVVAVPFAPFAELPFLPGTLVWMVVNTAALGLGALLCVAIATRLRAERPGRTSILIGLNLVVLSLAPFEAVAVGNIAGLMFAAYAAVLWALLSGRPVLAAAATAFVVLVKLYPGALVGWLLLRGRRHSLVALGAAALVVAVVGVSLLWPPMREAWLVYPEFVRFLVSSGVSDPYNQALASVVEARLGPDAAMVVHVPLAVGAVAATVVAARRGSLAGGFLVASAASLLVAPSLWRHSLLFLVPGLVAVAAADAVDRRLLAACVSLLVAGGLFHAPIPTTAGVILTLLVGLAASLASPRARRPVAD